MKYLERQGTFKAKAIQWSVKEASTGSLGVAIVFECREVKQGEEFRPLMPFAFVRGDFYVVKKDGTLMEKAAHELCMAFGWVGSFDEIRVNEPPDYLVQIDVEVQTYQGKQYYKARRVRPENASAEDGEVSEARAKELDKKHGEALREVAAKAAALRAAMPPAEPAPQSAKAATTTTHDDIPF